MENSNEKEKKEGNSSEQKEQKGNKEKTETKSGKEEEKSSKEKKDNKTSSTKEGGEEMVSVPKGTLEKILKIQEDQKLTIAEQDVSITRLNAMQDKKRVAWYDEKHSTGELIRTYKVGVYPDKDTGEDRIVTGWETVKDEIVFVDNVIKVNQITRLFLDQGAGNKPKSVEISIMEFARNLKREIGEVVKEGKTNDGETKTLRMKDGREIEFDVRFLNP